MQSHYRRDSCFVASPKHGWRNHCQCVMDVNTLRIKLLQNPANFGLGIPRPYCAGKAAQALQRTLLIQLPVVAPVESHLISGLPEQGFFLFDDHVFAARKLILVMNDQDPQSLESSADVISAPQAG